MEAQATRDSMESKKGEDLLLHVWDEESWQRK
ncbi:hypothetical protein CCACVL1_23584 [Corchorus capsularis]|uniref:Uncharacterized protein n=1 Tax=Corchorus capsularis TaxID=210143 RepID=A0A1R3GT97_COCAP|nr:hypothetical protein CCACVL1_23584 [Corchorus capsularis]